MLERKRRRRGGERKEGGKEEKKRGREKGRRERGEEEGERERKEGKRRVTNKQAVECGGEGRGEGLPWHSPSHPHDPLHFWKRTQTRELVLCVKTEGGAVKIWPSVFLCGQTMTVLLGQDPLQ